MIVPELLRQHIALNPGKDGFSKYVPMLEQLSNEDLGATMALNPYTVNSIGEAFAAKQWDRMDSLILSIVYKTADAKGVVADPYAFV